MLGGGTILKKIIKKIIEFSYRFIINDKMINCKLNKIKEKKVNNIFVFPSPGTPWGYMFQRPQQFANCLAKLGNTVLYCVQGNYKYNPDNSTFGVKKLKKNLYLYNDMKSGKMMEGFNKIIIWRYWASQFKYLGDNCKNVIQIYDWLDDNEVHKYNDKYLKIHNQLVLNSDLVIVTSEKLYNDAIKIKNDVVLVPNACDYEHFSNEKIVKWTKLKKLRSSSRVIVVYYGAIAEWMDIELIVNCAKNKPEWIFLIVGQEYPGINVRETLKGFSNIIVWKRVPYSKLPTLLFHCDIAIIPFKINNITERTSPVKVYEYMAAGKPIISTAMHEMKNLNNVMIANNHMEFIKTLDKAYILSKDEAYKNKLRNEAKLNSWDNRASIILKELSKRGLI